VSDHTSANKVVKPMATWNALPSSLISQQQRGRVHGDRSSRRNTARRHPARPTASRVPGAAPIGRCTMRSGG